MAKKNKEWVVTATDESGYVSVFGPYTEGKAEAILESIEYDDTSQKVLAYVSLLSKYRGEFKDD